MDKRIKNFSPRKIMSNENIKEKINNLIDNHSSIINKILELIPKKDEEKKQKQKDIKYIYEKLFLNMTKLKEIEIDLDPLFWDKANDCVKNKVKEYFNKKILYLQNINENEEEALNILETIYKYIQPELKENEDIRFVPNQYKQLLEYNKLSEEKDLNQNFKDMLKNIFNYDISCFLKYKKLKYIINKELSINEEIIKIIKKGFSNDSLNLEEKSKEFIKFYPKIEDKNEENYVLKFIDCYKSLTEEKFEEEEINTDNIIIWDKAIQILSVIILEKINSDEHLNNTSKRIKIDENKTLEKLNIFYSILFKMNLDKKKLDNYSFIPNEKGNYLKLKKIYMNDDIDDDIKEVLTLLNEKESFDNILIHHKLQLKINHSQKKLEDIALIIDKEMKKIYNDIDSKLQRKDVEIKIDENIKKGCKLLLHKWFKEHRDKINLFEFIKSHLADISVKILFDEETKSLLDDLLINDPESLVEMIKFQSPFAPFFYTDESSIEFIDESSFDATRDSSINQQNQFNFNFNFNRNRRRNYNRNRNYNYQYLDWARIRYEEGIKKYCKAQAYVYEKLLESHAFNEIVWINRISEDLIP